MPTDQQNRGLNNLFLVLLLTITLFACKQSSTTTIVQSNDISQKSTKQAGEIDHYICFKEDDITDLEMSLNIK